jgi:hypothetical protein
MQPTCVKTLEGSNRFSSSQSSASSGWISMLSGGTALSMESQTSSLGHLLHVPLLEDTFGATTPLQTRKSSSAPCFVEVSFSCLKLCPARSAQSAVNLSTSRVDRLAVRTRESGWNIARAGMLLPGSHPNISIMLSHESPDHGN